MTSAALQHCKQESFKNIVCSCIHAANNCERLSSITTDACRCTHSIFASFAVIASCRRSCKIADIHPRKHTLRRDALHRISQACKAQSHHISFVRPRQSFAALKSDSVSNSQREARARLNQLPKHLRFKWEAWLLSQAMKIRETIASKAKARLRRESCAFCFSEANARAFRTSAQPINDICSNVTKRSFDASWCTRSNNVSLLSMTASSDAANSLSFASLFNLFCSVSRHSQFM
mmetsp:Transcript_100430/g.158882  ORF Transcript_100430/g.158882 Transcript_100430/m.158882 type:complete len:234 (-) Transcript_100430:147-848(-)